VSTYALPAETVQQVAKKLIARSVAERQAADLNTAGPTKSDGL